MFYRKSSKFIKAVQITHSNRKPWLTAPEEQSNRKPQMVQKTDRTIATGVGRHQTDMLLHTHVQGIELHQAHEAGGHERKHR